MHGSTVGESVIVVAGVFVYDFGVVLIPGGVEVGTPVGQDPKQ